MFIKTVNLSNLKKDEKNLVCGMEGVESRGRGKDRFT